MKQYGWMFFSSLLGMALAIAVSEPQSFAATTQFFSWVTPSGEMVLTDDPGQIPPPHTRGPVSVHHFQETTRSSPTHSTSTANFLHTAPLAGAPGGAPLDLTDAEASDLMDILLESPEQGMAGDYDWVSLASPAYHGAGPIYGFWSNRAVSNPSLAYLPWMRYQNEIQRGTAASPSRRWTRALLSRRWSEASPKFVRDRQPLIGSFPTRGPSPSVHSIAHTPHTSPTCCTVNHQSRSGHRSAPRR